MEKIRSDLKNGCCEGKWPLKARWSTQLRNLKGFDVTVIIYADSAL